MSCIGQHLASMVARGLLTLEHLDEPSPSWAELEEDRYRSLLAEQESGWPGRRTPAFRYPGAGTRLKQRNLAREWIAAHPEEWAAMLERSGADNTSGQSEHATDCRKRSGPGTDPCLDGPPAAAVEGRGAEPPDLSELAA